MINKIPILQYVAMLTVNLSVASTGMHYGWPVVSIPKLLDKSSPIELNDFQASWIVSIFLIGAIVGTLTATTFLDRIGRKLIIVAACILLIISWVTMAFSSSFFLLLFSRFIGGLADGPIYCAVPVYFAEISSPNIRGFIGSSVSISQVFGTVIINVVGLYCSLFTTFIIALIFPILSLVTIFCLPKSPYYLIMKNNLKEARESFTKFKINSNVDSEFDELAQTVLHEKENSGKLLDVFTIKSNRRALYIIMITRGAQQCSGIWAIIFYFNTIFNELGTDKVLSRYGSIIYFTIQLVLCALSSGLVDVAGRKFLMIISLSGSSLALLTLTCYFFLKNVTYVDVTTFNLIPMIALVVFIISFNMGMYSIPMLLTGEIFPTDVKAFAFCLCDVYFYIVVLFVTTFFDITKDNYGLHVPFGAFFVLSFVGCLCIAKFVPETKQKTLVEIQDLLKSI